MVSIKYIIQSKIGNSYYYIYQNLDNLNVMFRIFCIFLTILQPM